MKIGFVGLGKLGLPVALAVESKGHDKQVMIFQTMLKILLKLRRYHIKKFGLKIIQINRILNESLKNVVNRSEIIFVPIQTPHDPYEGITRIPDKRIDFDYSFLILE